MARILVVDDEAALRRLLAIWLQADGHDVIEADSGAQAIEFARAAVDLVIMDINLPDMTGFSATQRIRALDDSTIPIICLTGFDMRLEAAHEGGCTDLLLKPIERKQFMETVRRYVAPVSER